MPDFGDVAGTTLTEIFSENRAEINIGVGREDTNPVFFKLWQVIKQGVTPLQKIRALTGSLGCIMKTNAGLGSIEFGLFESTDGGVSFDSVFRVSTGSTSFQDLDAVQPTFSFKMMQTLSCLVLLI